jgi:hypothetical protein
VALVAIAMQTVLQFVRITAYSLSEGKQELSAQYNKTLLNSAFCAIKGMVMCYFILLEVAYEIKE